MSRRLRIASFNLENLDDSADAAVPLETRMAVLRPQLLRLEADVLCLQEINGQRLRKGEPRRLIALDRLLEDTPYRDYARASTSGPGGGVADVHNVVILSRFPIVGSSELRHQLVEPPTHRMITAPEPSGDTERIRWDRPVMLTELDAGGARLHVLNIHLRAPLAAIIPGQKQGAFSWRSVGGWAEGFFIAAVKRAGQALEVRLMVDRLFDADPGALVAVCGDFNAGLDEVPTRIIRGAE
ncbi:MAG: endonuclease/exonuclease/phosphatase family protein, partial [Alphaproteobacteria bacterium]